MTWQLCDSGSVLYWIAGLTKRDETWSVLQSWILNGREQRVELKRMETLGAAAAALSGLMVHYAACGFEPVDVDLADLCDTDPDTSGCGLMD